MVVTRTGASTRRRYSCLCTDGTDATPFVAHTSPSLLSLLLRERGRMDGGGEGQANATNRSDCRCNCTRLCRVAFPLGCDKQRITRDPRSREPWRQMLKLNRLNDAMRTRRPDRPIVNKHVSYKRYFNETFIKTFIVPQPNNDFGYTNR